MKNEMTFKETTKFFEDMCWSNLPSALTADMLIYFLSTIEKKISENSSDAQDFISDLTRYVYHEMTSHGQNSTYKYIENIDVRLETFKYSQNANENWDKAKKEVYGEEEKVLDLSEHRTKEDECLDLAKHLSAIMLNKNTPVTIYNALADELTKRSIEPEVYYSPNDIASIICHNEDEQ